MMNPNEILKLNTAGQELEVSAEDADELGAFEETAITEQEAIESTEYDEG